LESDEEMSLSHAPLLWMVREARKAGLQFNEDALETSNCHLKEVTEDEKAVPILTLSKLKSPDLIASNIPLLELDGELFPPSPQLEKKEHQYQMKDQRLAVSNEKRDKFHQLLQTACTKGRIHDALEFNTGTLHGEVLTWRIMENMPFRRMDLQPNGTWKPISWPLPQGETRDIPADAWIHHTAIRRMEHDPTYRPGNLIVGGGGRGVRKAPMEHGIGHWKVLREHGDAMGEVVVRADRHPDPDTKTIVYGQERRLSAG